MVTPQMFVKVVTTGEQALVKGINEAFDGVADVGGSGTFETIQAADDFLDSGAYALWDKSGTYTAGFTVSTNSVYIYMEPGTTIQGAITLSGTDITLVVGAASNITGALTVSGANNSVICQNGVDWDQIVLSGAFAYFDGGGWNTIVDGSDEQDAINVQAADCIIKNVSLQTDAGGGNNFDGIESDGNSHRLNVINVKVVDVDRYGIYLGGDDCLALGCTVLGSDVDGIWLNGPRARIIGNTVIAAGADGIHVAATGDNSVIDGNLVQNQSNQSIDIDTDAENCVVVGNRVDGAVSDNSGTSTVASNDETAF